MLVLDNITVELGGRKIVENFSLKLEKGRCLALSGASGCGKTTILRAVAGLIALNSGTCIVRAKRLAYLFQEPRLLPWQTAGENVALTAPYVCRDRLKTLFHELYLDEKDLDKYPHELSGGMQQRVSLARALITDPDFLLMDEPFSALDARLRHVLQTRIMQAVDDGMSVLLVTHDVQEAVRMAHHIYCLQGKPARCIADISLPQAYSRRHPVWINEQANHEALQGIEHAALHD